MDDGRRLETLPESGEQDRQGLGAPVLAQKTGHQATLGEAKHSPLTGLLSSACAGDIEGMRFRLNWHTPSKILSDDWAWSEACCAESLGQPLRKSLAVDSRVN